MIEFKLTALAGFVLIPFGLFGKTAFAAERVLGNVISSGVKVLALAVIVGIGSTLFSQFTAGFGGNQPTIEYALSMVLAALSPQGTRLIGVYDSQVAFGQSRVLLVWTRLIMPNGRSVVLERQAGADTAGYAGLEDGVDNHWGTLFKAALLSTLLGVGSELGSTTGTGSNSDVITALRRGSSDSLNQAGQKVVHAQSQYPADTDDTAGFPGAGDSQSRPRARALRRASTLPTSPTGVL